MKSAVIVQARFGSTRLPGKVLLRLGSKTVLAHVLERCAQIAADVVVCAVPTGPQDDRVAEEAASCGAYVTRGDEQDVLSRYADAARAIGADVVMRVTSDCPLIEPSLCTKVIEIVRRGVADYACNNMPRSFAHGLDCEAFLASTLFEAERQTVDPYDRAVSYTL